MEISTTASAAPLRPGNSGQSVGHLAKAAIAEARANGVDLPMNAQGIAASQIAKGADPASIFAAQVVTEGDDVPVAPEEEPFAEVSSEAEAGYAAATTVLRDVALTDEEAALALLQKA